MWSFLDLNAESHHPLLLAKAVVFSDRLAVGKLASSLRVTVEGYERAPTMDLFTCCMESKVSISLVGAIQLGL